MATLKVFVVRKFVKAVSVSDALKKEKKTIVSDINEVEDASIKTGYLTQ
jgi:hypothetical protein